MTTTTATAGSAPGAVPLRPSETVRDLPLSALTLTERNVRTVDGDPADFERLKASILAHGIIQNLTVRVVGDRCEVIAGKRRFRASRELVEAGEVPPDMMVPCRVLDEFTNDIEISLAENEVRVGMHPVDQVTAFRRLTEEGIAREKIAERFGLSTRTVDQRLRLAGLPAEILDAARDDKLNLEHLQAFAATADQSRQLEVWNRIKNASYQPGADWIRAELTRESVRADEARARFVGVDAYTAAGGRVEVDLFSDGDDDRAMLLDPDILDKLAADKLQQVADDLKAQGWKWAEPHLELEWDAAQQYGRLRGTPAEPTAQQAADLERIHKRIGEIEEQLQKILDDNGGDDAGLPEDHAFYTLQAEREQLEEDENRIGFEIDQNVTYTPEQMACAGCLVTIDGFAGLTVHAGLVRAADAKDVSQPPAPGGDEPGNAVGHAVGHAAGGAPDGYVPPTKRPAATNPETEAVKAAGLSNNLAEEMRLVRNAMVKGYLANDFEAAFDLTAYEMSLSAFSVDDRGARPLAMTLNGTSDRPLGSPEELKAFEATSPGIELLENNREGLPLDWLAEKDPRRRFLAFTDLPLGDRQRLFAAAAARALNKQLSFDHGHHAETEATIARLDIPFEAVWRPGLDRFWSRMRKGEMMDIARRTLGPEWAAAHAKDKKHELAEAMAAAFGRDGDADTLGLTADARAAALGWTPTGFRAFDPARPPEEDGAAAGGGEAAEPDDAGPQAEASPDDAEENAAAPTAADAVEGKVLQHPAAQARNGDGAALDDTSAGNPGDEDAPAFDHGPAEELPPFLQKQE